MGLSRTIYGVLGHRLNLKVFIAASAALGVGTYLVAALTAMPVLGLIACALTGFAVGIMWPGTFALAAEAMPTGGTLMFAVAGDLGCTAGPAIVGTVAAANGDSLQAGLLVGALFPVILLVGVIALRQILYITRRNG